MWIAFWLIRVVLEQGELNAEGSRYDEVRTRVFSRTWDNADFGTVHPLASPPDPSKHKHLLDVLGKIVASSISASATMIKDSELEIVEGYVVQNVRLDRLKTQAS